MNVRFRALWLLAGWLLFLGAAYPADAQRRVIVSGYVTDAHTGDPLVGVGVIDTVSHKGVVTDNNGHYALPLMTGDAVLSYSLMGYEMSEKSVTLVRNMVFDIKLKPDTQRIKESLITSGRTVYSCLLYTSDAAEAEPSTASVALK